MENHLDCPLCQKSISYAGFHKHIFSSTHKDDLEALILKRKQHLLKYVEGKDHSAMPYVIPDLKKSITTLKFCYGCKKAFISKSYFKKHACPHIKEQLEHIKTILAKEVSEEPPVDVSKYTKRIESLEKTLKAAEAIVDKSEDISQALIELLQRLQENHIEIFRNEMVKLRLSRPEVFSEMCEALDFEDEVGCGGGSEMSEGGTQDVCDPFLDF